VLRIQRSYSLFPTHPILANLDSMFRVVWQTSVSIFVCVGLFAMLMFCPDWLEVLLLLGFISLPFFAWRIRKPALIFPAALLGFAGIVLHLSGYKIFGAAQVVPTPPLRNAKTVAALDPPSVIRFSDGTFVTLKGVTIPTHATLPSSPNDQTLPLWDLLCHGEPKLQIRAQVKPDNGRAICLQKCCYFCGNTFMPTFFPKRLPSHRVVDLGEYLVLAGLAVPSRESGSDPDYHQRLEVAFLHRADLSSAAASSGSPAPQ